MLKYSVTLTPDDNNTFLVTSPDFPEVTSFGETINEALSNAARAIQEAIGARIADQEEIPAPTVGEETVELPTSVALKSALYSAMKEQNLTRADLMRRLDWHRNQVDRLFVLDHNTKLDQFDEAFKALGLELNLVPAGTAENDDEYVDKRAYA